MAVNTSIQSSTNLKVDQIVVISVDLLQSLLESNNKQHEAIKHLSDTMEKFVNEFLNTRMENESLRDQYRSSVKTNDSNVSNHSMTSSDELQQEILAKLDALSRTLASNTPLANKSIETELKESANRRKILLSKINRAENLSRYYTKLVTRDDPFVPRMFRTKVNRSTPDFEKPTHKEMAITRVKHEVALMVDRMKHWKIQLQKLESSINAAVTSLDKSKTIDFYSRLAKDEENVERDRAESFDKIHRSYEMEMNANEGDKELYLLTYVKERSIRGRYRKKYRSNSQFGLSNYK